MWTPPEESGSGDVTVNITIVVDQPTIYVLSYTITEVIGTNTPATITQPFINDATPPTPADLTDVTVGWQKPFNGSNPIRFYMVSMRQTLPLETPFVIIWHGLAYQATLTGLQAGNTYEVIVQANNTYLNSPSPALSITPVAFGTTVAPVPSTPVIIGAPTLQSITFSWVNSGSGASGAQFIGYVLQMKPSGTSDSQYRVVYFGQSASATVAGLVGATTYVFRLMAKSLAGPSAFGSAFLAQTYGSDCSEVGSFVTFDRLMPLPIRLSRTRM